jgi:hypothetical protein
MDLRKRQIISALRCSAGELEAAGSDIEFEGNRYLVVDVEYVGLLIYAMRKAAAWMEQEEGENGEEAEAEAEGVLTWRRMPTGRTC